MKKIIALFLILFIVGCGAKNDVDVKSSGDTVTIETEDTKVEATAGEDDWCSTGATWSSTGPDGSAKMVVVGIESSGKYKGYCHVKYDIDSEGDDAKMDFYFDEDDNGYQIMDVNGQHIEMEISG